MPSIAPAPPKELPDPSDVKEVSVPTGVSLGAIAKAIEKVFSRSNDQEHDGAPAGVA
jgi:hypothetical protein